MRGSILARKIENDNKRAAYIKKKALKMKALKEQYEQRKRGKGNEDKSTK